MSPCWWSITFDLLFGEVLLIQVLGLATSWRVLKACSAEHSGESETYLAAASKLSQASRIPDTEVRRQNSLQTYLNILSISKVLYRSFQLFDALPNYWHILVSLDSFLVKEDAPDHDSEWDWKDWAFFNKETQRRLLFSFREYRREYHVGIVNTAKQKDGTSA